MKIAITGNTTWYLYNFRKNTIKSLIEEGYQVVAISPFDEYVEPIQELGAKHININIDKGGTNPFKDLKTLYEFYLIYKAHSIDLVLNFTPKNNVYSTFAAKFNKIPVINNIAGLGVLFINENFTSKIARLLYKLSQKNADKIFFQNEDDRTLFLDSGFSVLAKTDRLPGSGVDLSRFSVSRSDDDGVVRFLLIARMLYDKGIAYYVDAAKLLKQKFGDNVEFNLLGFLDVDNPSAVSKEQMQAWVDEGFINYLGTSDKVEEHIAKVDCMVLPSYYREGVPKSLLEAAAMGKPIVTTDNVGCRETVDDGINGYLCKVRSTSSLIDALEKIIQLSHEERLAMGQESRKKIEREFDERIVINKYIASVKELVKEKY